MSGQATRVDVREAVVTAALGWVGTPYRHQASTKGVGCDCLGLVRGVWRELYGAEPEPVPPYAPDWAECGRADLLIDAARRHCVQVFPGAMRPGDLLVLRWRAAHGAKHLGILCTPDSFVHAYERHAVMVSPLVAPWRRRIAGVFAFPAR